MVGSRVSMLMMEGSRLILRMRGRRGQRLPAWCYTAPVRAGDPRAEVVDFP
jgi:hypothetical protein